MKKHPSALKFPVTRRFAAGIVLCAVVAAAGGLTGLSKAYAADDPATVIASYQGALLQAMKAGKAAGFEGRRKIVAPAVRKAYDLQTIARRSAGGAGWRKMNAQEKTAYVEAFAAFSIASHANSFSGFSGEKFVRDGVDELQRGYRLVKTRIVRASGEPVAINYLMASNGGNWQVVDVFVKGTISEVATRRAEFSAVIRDKGPKALIDLLKARAASLSQN